MSCETVDCCVVLLFEKTTRCIGGVRVFYFLCLFEVVELGFKGPKTCCGTLEWIRVVEVDRAGLG